MLTPVDPDSDNEPPACKEISAVDLMLTPCDPLIVTVPELSIVIEVCVIDEHGLARKRSLIGP